MVYAYFTDLSRRTESDKVLYYKAFDAPVKPKYHVYQREVASIVYSCLDKKVEKTGKGVFENQELANQLHKSITKN